MLTKKEKGFTLVELLVVIGIMTPLAQLMNSVPVALLLS